MNFAAFTPEMIGFAYRLGRGDGPRNFHIRVIVNQTRVVSQGEFIWQVQRCGQVCRADWNPGHHQVMCMRHLHGADRYAHAFFFERSSVIRKPNVGGELVKFGFRFCPKCGAPLEERVIGEQLEPVCTRAECGYIFWQNSKPCTCAVIENERGEVLLCVRKHEPDAGKIDLPGGFLEFGEHPHDAIHREIREELGVQIEIEAGIGFVMDWYDGKDVATLNIPFVAHIVEGTPTPNDDVAAIQWRRLDDIDRAELAFRNNEVILFDLYAQYRK